MKRTVTLPQQRLHSTNRQSFHAYFRRSANRETMATKASLEISTSTPGLDREAMVYEALTSIPSIGKVWMNPTVDQHGVKVSMEVIQKDVPQNAVRKSLVHCLIDPCRSKTQHLDTFSSTSLDNVVFRSPSPSGSKALVVRKSDADKGSVLQIWNQATVEYELVIPEKLHGPIVNDGWFGSRASWSADEMFVAYVAERPKKSQTPEWGDGFGKGRGGAADNGEEAGGVKAKGRVWRGVGEFEDDWGEANTGKQAPVVFVLDVAERLVTMAMEPDAEKSYGQPVWSPKAVDGNHLVYVQWNHSSSIFPNLTERLGIVYCFNRPCEMVVRAWPGDPEKETNAQGVNTGLKSAFSPQFTDGGDLVFLSQENAVRSGTHSATPEVHSKTWDSIVGGTEGAQGFSYGGSGDFPGMYASVLADGPALTLDGHAVLFATVQWRSKTAVVALDVTNGEILRASPEGAPSDAAALDPSSSWAFLGASSNGYVLAQASAPNVPCRLFAKRMTSLESLEDPLTGWQEVYVPGVVDACPELARTALEAISASIAEISAFDADVNPIKTFEATLIGPNQNEKAPRPTLLVPHGGPHTAYSTQFIPSISFLAACGYNVITVNYRGSTGFGEASLQSLPGNIGTADVQDCMAALEHFASEGAVLPDQVAVVGGSHGGFLTGHLIGQFPTVFKAAVMRNPVCNISLMVHLTDIPDWCYIETFGSEEGFFRAQARNTREDLIAMEQKSPVRYIDSVQAAVLVMLGACDRRVPLDDGKRYVSRLKQSDHAPDTRVVVFEKDEHGLTRPQTDFEQWITCLWWLRHHGCGTSDAS